MIAHGTPVFWSQTNFLGEVVRVVKARTMEEPFRIVRSDLQEVELVKLDCLRIAPVNSISLVDPGVVIDRSARRRSERAEVRNPIDVRPAESDDARESRKSDFPPLAEGTCNVLAFDFLNLLVRAFHAGSKTETHAVRSLFQTAAAAIRKIRPAHVVFAMDGGHVMRSELMPEYKAHRPESEPLLKSQKALAEQALKIAGFHCVRIDGWEADDVLASIGTSFSQTVICSSDKDLLALDGRCRIYHPWKDGAFVTAEEKLEIPAGMVTDYLALCGDTSDGIPGVKGIGPKTALALLQEWGCLDSIIVAASTGRIKGSAGQKLKEQRDSALLCRRVVQLNHDLPLPELVDWKPFAGWQQQLQALRLGSVAAIVESLQGQRFASRSGQIKSENATAAVESPLLSAPAEQGEQGCHEEVLPDQQSLQPAQPSCTEQVFGSPVPSVVPVEPSDMPPVSAGHVAGSAGWIYRSISEPIRQAITMAERWDGPDRGLISCWECGREAAGTAHENGWKPGTANHIAWKQGFNGFDLSVQIVDRDDVRLPAADPESPRRQHAGSLF